MFSEYTFLNQFTSVAIFAEQDVDLVMLTAKTYTGFEFSGISSAFEYLGPDLKLGAFHLEKESNIKIYIGTKCTFLSKFFFSTRMRPSLQIDTYDKINCLVARRAQNPLFTITQ